MTDYRTMAADLIDKEPVRDSDYSRETIMRRVLATTLESLDTERTRADEAEKRERELLKLVRPLVDAASRFNGVYVCQDRVAAPFQGQMMLALQAIGREMPSLIQPEPDPLVQEARNIVASMPGLNALQARAYRDGDWDAGGSVDIALAALKRGMELSIVKEQS